MEELTEAISQYTQNLNVIFIIAFILLSWLMNVTVDATNFAKGFSIFRKIPKVFRVICLAICLSLVFIFLGGYSSKSDIFSLILSTITSMVIYKIGVNKIFKIIAGKLGINLE